MCSSAAGRGLGIEKAEAHRADDIDKLQYPRHPSALRQRSRGNTWTDPDDAPELTDEFPDGDGARRLQGDPARPAPAANSKVQVTLRLDTSVLDKLRALGPGWQTRANAILGDGLAEYDGHRLKPPPADRRTVATGPVASA